MALTPKQEAFCLAYLKTGNASESYRLSYNSSAMKSTTINKKASLLLARGDIGARLEELNKSAVSAAVMTRQEALERLTSFARTDLADLVEFGHYAVGEDEEGQPIIQAAWKIKDSTLQDPAKMASIAELSAGKDGIKVKTHSPMAAIQQLAKMQGWEAAQKTDSTVRIVDSGHDEW